MWAEGKHLGAEGLEEGRHRAPPTDTSLKDTPRPRAGGRVPEHVTTMLGAAVVSSRQGWPSCSRGPHSCLELEFLPGGRQFYLGTFSAQGAEADMGVMAPEPGGSSRDRPGQRAVTGKQESSDRASDAVGGTDRVLTMCGVLYSALYNFCCFKTSQ